MKSILTSLFIACVTIFLVPTISAAPQGRSQATGGLESGKRFTLRVIKVIIIQRPTGGKFPAEVPKFNKGCKVKFNIGNNGQLKGPGLIVPLYFAEQKINTYLTGVDTTVKVMRAHLTKDATGEPKAMELDIFKSGSAGDYSYRYLFKRDVL